VVGSNTANVLLVLGVPALLAGLATSGHDARGSYWQMIAATALFIVVCFLGPIAWWHGIVLLAGLAVMLGLAFAKARAHRRNGEEDVEGADPSAPGWRIASALVLGLVGLPLGADLLVNGSTEIAKTFGMSDEAIGLTLVAVGTSLPELATTVMAAYRRQADVAIGNVLGSNMFNLLAIVGIAALVGPIPVAPAFLTFDLWVMAGASLVVAVFVFGRDITRTWGAVLTLLYVAYVAVVLM
jgi:cation:H+ antiporter